MKLSRITLLVRGMSCAACVHRVEQALNGLEGVSRADINLATEKATIEYDVQLVSPEKIREKISEVGYQALDLEPVLDRALAKTTLLLGGMTCAACVRRVEGALRGIPEVREAAVNLATSRATVTHVVHRIDAPTLKKVIEDAGYEFLGLESATLDDPVEAARNRELQELT